MEPRKRKISEEEESQQNISKIFKKAFNEDFQYSLEHFCDEILLVVLNYLDSESLYNLDKFGPYNNRI